MDLQGRCVEEHAAKGCLVGSRIYDWLALADLPARYQGSAFEYDFRAFGRRPADYDHERDHDARQSRWRRNSASELHKALTQKRQRAGAHGLPSVGFFFKESLDGRLVLVLNDLRN